LQALRGPEPRLQRVEQHRGTDLGASAATEQLPGERVHRVDVVAPERRTGHAAAVVRIPGVDARDVLVDVVQGLHALRPGVQERGVSVRINESPARPNRSDLKYVVRSLGVTAPNRGVSPSYIFACVSAPAGTGRSPYCPDGMMLSAWPAKSCPAAEARGAATR